MLFLRRARDVGMPGLLVSESGGTRTHNTSPPRKTAAGAETARRRLGRAAASEPARSRRKRRGTSRVGREREPHISQRIFTCQRHFPKDCHFSSGCSLDIPNRLSVAFSNGISLL